eukprot:364425-Chlamydomonas_euryale.AAC.8
MELPNAADMRIAKEAELPAGTAALVRLAAAAPVGGCGAFRPVMRARNALVGARNLPSMPPPPLLWPALLAFAGGALVACAGALDTAAVSAARAS